MRKRFHVRCWSTGQNRRAAPPPAGRPRLFKASRRVSRAPATPPLAALNGDDSAGGPLPDGAGKSLAPPSRPPCAARTIAASCCVSPLRVRPPARLLALAAAAAFSRRSTRASRYAPCPALGSAAHIRRETSAPRRFQDRRFDRTRESASFQSLSAVRSCKLGRARSDELSVCRLGRESKGGR